MIGNINLEFWRNHTKREMNMRVLVRQNLGSIHAKTESILIEALEISDGLETVGRMVIIESVESAIGDAAIRIWLCSTRCVCVCRRLGAEVGCCTTVSPDITACI